MANKGKSVPSSGSGNPAVPVQPDRSLAEADTATDGAHRGHSVGMLLLCIGLPLAVLGAIALFGFPALGATTVLLLLLLCPVMMGAMMWMMMKKDN